MTTLKSVRRSKTYYHARKIFFMRKKYSYQVFEYLKTYLEALAKRLNALR